MTTRTLRAAAACALLATTCLVSPAKAQQTAVPSAYKNIDDNGVDLTDGTFNFSLVEGTIGAGEGALSLIRYGAGGSSLDNWSNIFLSKSTSGATTMISVALGNRSESFVSDGTGGFTAKQATGTTLSGSGSQYTFRNSDGTEILFGPPIEEEYAGQFPFDDGSVYQSATLPALRIVEPAGKTVSLAWEVHTKCDRVINPDGTPAPCQYFWRLSNVANNLGYAMAVAYAPGGLVNGQASPAWFKRASVTFGNNAVVGGPSPTVSYAFPASNITEVTDTGGRMWRITTDTSGRIVAIKRPGAASDSTTIVYGANGVAQVTRDGVTTNYSRTVSGATATMVATDALQHGRTVVSDLNIGRPTQVTNEVGNTTAFVYDGNGRLTEATLPEGNKILTAYDARGNVTSTTARAKPGSGAADIVATAGYEAGCANPATCNQPLWTRDADGNQTDFAYDAAGHVVSMTAPAPTAGAVRPQTRYGYTPVVAPGGGSVSLLTTMSACQTAASCTGSADEARSSVAYGTPNLLPSQVSSGAGDGSLTATTTMAYDTIGNLVTVDGPLPGAGDTTRTLYNASREVVGAIGPDPDGAGPLKHRAARTAYNADGQATVQESGTVTDQSDAGWSGFVSLEQANITYDVNGRALKRTLTAGGTAHAAIEYSYDAEGRSECTAQRMNPASFGGLANACSLTAEGSFGPDRISRTVYDAADRVIATQVAVGTAAEATEASGAYSTNGLLASLTDGENNKTSYAFDGHDRLSRTFYPVVTKGANASSGSDFEELGYDGRSNVVSRRVRDGQLIGYSYDALSRLTFKNLPGTEPDVTYGYDNLGRLKTASDTNGYNGGFSYDALGRQLTEFSSKSGTRSSQYDLAGRRTRLTWNDGFFVTYDQLVTGETSAIRENGAGAGVGVLASFAYDDLGRRTGLTRGNGTVTSYGFDPVSRLAQLTQDIGGTATDLSLGFSYNPASQITSNSRSNDAFAWTGHGSGTTGSTANGLNQLTQVGAAALSYDGKGNLTSDGTKAYGYTAENRLASAPGTQVGYDPLGRLYDLASTQTVFDHDGVNVIAELDSPTGQQVRRRYVHGPGLDEALVWYEGAGTADRRFLHADERGSVVAASDSAGNTIGVNKYDEYGVPAATNIGRFQYTGQKWMGEVGLYDYKARVYDPKLGRFLQTDPIGYEDGLNGYIYVGGDPINRVDPTGTRSVDDWEEEKRRRAREKEKKELEEKSNSLAVTEGEKASLRRGDVREFWESRKQRGDPIAEIALASIADKGSGWIVNNRLDNWSLLFTGAVADKDQIRLDLARAHAVAVMNDRYGVIGLLSSQQVTNYHYIVFRNHGIPGAAFGGSLIPGRWWCSSCDRRTRGR